MINALIRFRSVLPLVLFLLNIPLPLSTFASEKNVLRNKQQGDDTKKIESKATKTQSAFTSASIIVSPQNRTITCADSIAVVAHVVASGGIAPYSLACTINGKSVIAVNDTVQTHVPIIAGENFIGVHAVFTDAAGNVTQSADTVVVEKCTPMTGSLEIVSPTVGAYVCDDSVEVTVAGNIDGGVPGYSVSCFINGIPAVVYGDTMRARIPVYGPLQLIGATCVWTDAEGGSIEASDVILINRCDPLQSSVDILAPLPQATVCGSEIEVVARVAYSGGVGPVATECTVNGQTVEITGDTLRASVSLSENVPIIAVHCIFTDSLGNMTQSADTVTVQFCEPLQAGFTEINPANRAIICEDSVLITAVYHVSGGQPPYQITANVNNFPAIIAGDTLRATVPLQQQTNFIGLYSLINDAAGNLTQIADTLYLEKCTELQSRLDIIWPLDAVSICADSIEVIAVAEVTGGQLPITATGAVNGIPAKFIGDTLQAKIPVSSQTTLLAAYAVFTDAQGNQSFSSDVSTLRHCDNFSASAQILFPTANATYCDDSLVVTAVVDFAGGERPISVTGSINGMPLRMKNDTLTATIPLLPDATFIGLHAMFTDNAGNIAQAADTLTVQSCKEDTFLSFASILEPLPFSEFCDDSIEVVAFATVAGGTAPISADCQINGIPAAWRDDTVRVKIPLLPEQNFFRLTCRFTDADGRETTAVDSVTVFGCSQNSFTGHVEILYPRSGQLICEDSIAVTALVQSEGGVGGIFNDCSLNGKPVEVLNDTVRVKIARQPGTATFLGLYNLFTDFNGDITQAADTVTVLHCGGEKFRSSVAIFQPLDGAVVCQDSVQIGAVLNWSGGVEPVQVAGTINGKPLSVQGDTLRYRLPLPEDKNFVGIHCIFTDATGQVSQSADTVTIFRCDTGFRGEVTMISPRSGERFSSDSVLVRARIAAHGGAGLVTKEARINGQMVPVIGDSVAAYVALVPGPNFIGVHAVFTDAEGNITQAADTATVFQQGLDCNLVILSPKDSSLICHYDSIEVRLFSEITGATGGVQAQYTVNGRQMSGPAGEMIIKTKMKPGWLPIVASVFVEDASGVTAFCSDSIVVFFDKTPPQAEINFDNLPEISGTVWDHESGIEWIRMISIKNRTVEFDDFEPGAEKISFRSMPVDRNKPSGFTFKVKNMAGCFEEVDPIYLQLAPQGEKLQFTFKLPPQDRFMRIENRGIDRITLIINNKQVHFLTDVNQFYGPDPVYRLPKFGRLAIDIHGFLNSDSTDFQLICEGNAGTTADFLIADRETDQVITEIKEDHYPDLAVITRLKLGQNYPNPFNANTMIEYQLPDLSRVRLRIFNLLGQEIVTLVDKRQAPGIHRIRWDGRNQFSQLVASGVYIYVLEVKTPSDKHQVLVQKMNYLR